MACKVTFRIQSPVVESGEETVVMCITGCCKELGNWEPNAVVRMVQNQEQDLNRRFWQATVDLPGNSEIQYRYALCSFPKGNNGKGAEDKVVIHRWETNIQPRELVTKGAELTVEEESFGQYDGQYKIDRGWLTHQSEIIILIHGRPLTLQGHTEDEVPPYSIKVIARQERVTIPEGDTSSKKRKKTYDILPVFIRVLNGAEFEPRLHQTGRLFNKDDIILFSVQTMKPEGLSFKVEITTHEDDASPENLGVATMLGRNVQYCLPRHIPVIDEEMDSVGSLQVTCCMIKPLQPQNLCNFEKSFSKHWNWSRRCVEIGHRGMGRSLMDKSLLIKSPTNTNIPENTVKSLQQALKHGADFVEFDIHVTKDRVPVIGHDFQAALTPALTPHSGQGVPVYLEVPINFLNISEIDSLKTGQCLALEHTDKQSPCTTPTKVPIPKEMQLFPTLQFALEEVDLDLGFLIEVKYPMEILEGSKEMPQEKHPLERNLLTDSILNIILRYGGDRRIVLCAFDPYVCTMLRLKQNKYPVLYANFGPSERYDLYAGPLSSGIPVARLLAQSMGFLGLSSHSLDLLRYPELLTSCINSNLITFCWGEDNNDEEIVQRLKEMRVNGVIHDSMGKYPPNRNNIFKEEKLTKMPAMVLQQGEDPEIAMEEGRDPEVSVSKANEDLARPIFKMPRVSSPANLEVPPNPGYVAFKPIGEAM